MNNKIERSKQTNEIDYILSLNNLSALRISSLAPYESKKRIP